MLTVSGTNNGKELGQHAAFLEDGQRVNKTRLPIKKLTLGPNIANKCFKSHMYDV